MSSFDFAGWATRNNVRCSDGRTIRKDAFKDNDGETVPLVWNHQHNEPENVLGHALLRNMDDGVYAYCKFNDTESGQNAKLLVQHGDVNRLSIFANKLKEKAGDVLHGAIREVSLVLAGANPEATIETIAMSHSGDSIAEAIITTDQYITTDEDVLSHGESVHEPETEEVPMRNEYLEHSEEDSLDVDEIMDSMNEDQLALLLAVASEDDDEYDENDDADEYEDDYDYEEDEDMKHNAFESEGYYEEDNVLSHSDMDEIFRRAKAVGSLREATEDYLEGGTLAHGIAPIPTGGMDVATGTQTYAFNDVDMLYPDFKNLNMPPEFLSRDMGWVQKVIGGVHHTPFTRIKSMFADITDDEARAKGYIKGNRKKEEVFSLLKRTTTPTTIYKKQKMDREDIIDITDFDVVAWIKREMRMMLNEEIARAILLGDGRLNSSDDKIKEDCIRPIVKEPDLFNITYTVNNFSAKQFIDECVRSRKQYKGSGNPTLFTTEDLLTEMLLIEDGVGHKLYKTEAELATALRVSGIVTVEPMEGYQIGGKDLLGVIVNLSDYNVGVDKGGEISMFDDFDIDFNQYKYLMETRMSGALIKPFSAITLLKGTVGKNKVTTTLDVDNTPQG